MKRLFFISISLIFIGNGLLAQTNRYTMKLHNAEFVMGMNYSKLYSTESIGRIGVSFGANKIRPLSEKWNFKYGFLITSKQSQQKNKSIFYSDSMVDEYIYSKNDLKYRFVFCNLNIRLEHNYIFKDKYTVYPIIGFGYNFYFTSFHNEVVKQSVEYEIYPGNLYKDYGAGDRESPLPLIENFENSGFSYSFGMGIKNLKYSLNVTYEINPFEIQNAGNVAWNEKYHQINLLLGIFVQE